VEGHTGSGSHQMRGKMVEVYLIFDRKGHATVHLTIGARTRTDKWSKIPIDTKTSYQL
jgi:hypothetical protein